MATHKTAALVVTFLNYKLKVSSTGDYYTFDVADKDGHYDVCRMDSIHRHRVSTIFNALDKGDSVKVPVIRDTKWGYRIDLAAIDDFFPRERVPSLPPPPPWETPVSAVQHSPSVEYPPLPPVKVIKPDEPQKRVRAQFYLDPSTYGAMVAISRAEGYKSYSDWLKGIIDRAIDAAAVAGRTDK
jgi:hypothetical protein